MLRTLYMIRHGESEWNACHKIQGQLDSHLSASGRRQARALFCRLRNETFDAVYASDLSRAADTALIATGREPSAIHLTPALREVSFGDWEGLTIDEVKRRYPEALQAFRQDPVNCRPATGESFDDLSSRIVGLLDYWHENHHGQGVAAFTHGGPVRAALIHLLGMPPENWRTLRVANTGLTRVDFGEGGPRLHYFDTTGHLCVARPGRAGGEDEVS